jgi:hypothetical protein
MFTVKGHYTFYFWKGTAFGTTIFPNEAETYTVHKLITDHFDNLTGTQLSEHQDCLVKGIYQKQLDTMEADLVHLESIHGTPPDSDERRRLYNSMNFAFAPDYDDACRHWRNNILILLKTGRIQDDVNTGLSSLKV